MNTSQQEFLNGLALKITRLFQVAEQGSTIAYFRFGTRMVNGKEVVLKLVVEDVDDEKTSKRE